jgi:hypothetical protein
MLATTSILAAFITPWLATAGAAAVAAPILIHLLARRRFRRIRWAAMDFLIDAERRNRRRIRMEEWILLALRCLAVFLVGLLVARPFLTPSGFASALKRVQRTERVLVLDDTFSMTYQVDDGSPFARAKTAARRLLTQIHEEFPDDTVSILRTSDPATPIVAGAFLDTRQLEELLARVESLEASERSMDLRAVFDGVVGALERDSSILNAAVYLVSDFQRKDWAQREAQASAGQELAHSLDAWAVEDRDLRLFFVNLGEEDAKNVAVTQLAGQGAQVVAGTESVVRAAIANYSGTSVGALPLQLTVGGRPAASKNLPGMDERQSTTVDLEASFLRAGDEPVRLELPHDKLIIDDTRYLTVPVVSAVRVLLVDGEPSGDAFDDEVALLATALRPEGEVFSGYEVTTVDEPGLEEVNAADFAAVVLANVFRVSDPMIEAIERYARDGGGVLIFLGDQIDADLYNSTLYKDGRGLLPARLVELVKPAEPAHLRFVDRVHPALRAIGHSADILGVGDVPFFSYFDVQPYAVEEIAGQGDAAPDSDRAAETRSAAVLAELGSADHPAIVERGFGKGRVVLIATSADKEWHLWPNHPTFLPMMLELVSYVARGTTGNNEQYIGGAVEVAFDPAVFQPDVSVRTPLYPNEPEVFVTAVAHTDGRGLVARWEQTARSGFYQFVLKRQDGGEDIRYVAVNVDPGESDLAMIEEAQVRKAMGDIPLEYIQGLDNLATGTSEGRTELWPFCLAFAVVVLMAEQTLAWRWGRARDLKPETRN